MEDQLIQLEAAIAQIESDAAGDVPRLSLPQRDAVNGAATDEAPGTELVLHQSSIQATVLNANLVEVLGPATSLPVQLHRLEPAQPLPLLVEFDPGYGPASQSVPPRPRRWFKSQIVAALLVGIDGFTPNRGTSGKALLQPLFNWKQGLRCRNPSRCLCSPVRWRRRAGKAAEMTASRPCIDGGRQAEDLRFHSGSV